MFDIQCGYVRVNGFCITCLGGNATACQLRHCAILCRDFHMLDVRTARSKWKARSRCTHSISGQSSDYFRAHSPHPLCQSLETSPFKHKVGREPTGQIHFLVESSCLKSSPLTNQLIDPHQKPYVLFTVLRARTVSSCSLTSTNLSRRILRT